MHCLLCADVMVSLVPCKSMARRRPFGHVVGSRPMVSAKLPRPRVRTRGVVLWIFTWLSITLGSSLLDLNFSPNSPSSSEFRSRSPGQLPSNRQKHLGERPQWRRKKCPVISPSPVATNMSRNMKAMAHCRPMCLDGARRSLSTSSRTP